MRRSSTYSGSGDVHASSGPGPSESLTATPFDLVSPGLCGGRSWSASSLVLGCFLPRKDKSAWITQTLYPPMSFWPPEDQLLHYACTGFYGDEWTQPICESTTEEVRELAEPSEEATEPDEALECKVPSSEVLIVAKALPPSAPQHPVPPSPPPATPLGPDTNPSFAAQEDLEWETIRATVIAADAVLAAVGMATASPAEASAATVPETQRAEAIDAGREAEDAFRDALALAEASRVQSGGGHAQQQAEDTDVVAWIEVEAKRPPQVEPISMAAAASAVPPASHDILGSRGSLLPEGCYRGSLLALGQAGAASGMSLVAGHVVGSAEAAAAAALASQQSCTARLPKVLRSKLQPPPPAPSYSVGGCPYKQGNRVPSLINVQENITQAAEGLSYESDASVESSDSVYTQT